MNKTSDAVMTTRQAAESLGVSLRTAQLWVESGVLQAWKTAGGHRRITRRSVDAVLAERSAALAGETGGPLKMLVVEDEPNLLRLYQLNIEAWDLPVRLITARNGYEGLIRIGEEHPTLLVVDLNMPGMDGFRMIKTLRENPAYKDLSVLVVTALSSADIRIKGEIPDDIPVFTKPVPFDKLKAIVEKQLLHLATKNRQDAP